jgi:hypothetical protein
MRSGRIGATVPVEGETSRDILITFARESHSSGVPFHGHPFQGNNPAHAHFVNASAAILNDAVAPTNVNIAQAVALSNLNHDARSQAVFARMAFLNPARWTPV